MIKVLVMGKKLNVVDSNNNLVGFDLEDSCCASGGYFITDDIKKKDFDNVKGIPDIDFQNYVFDQNFFEDVRDGHGEGGAVVFKMRPQYGWDYDEDENLPDLYLHLFNVHNGYYSKGFKYSFREIKEGSI